MSDKEKTGINLFVMAGCFAETMREKQCDFAPYIQELVSEHKVDLNEIYKQFFEPGYIDFTGEEYLNEIQLKEIKLEAWAFWQFLIMHEDID